MSSVVAVSGQFEILLPTWGRSFWQDSNNGNLFLAFVSGNTQAYFIRSADSGVTWDAPKVAFPVDNFSVHNNFDTEMDSDGNVHCVYSLNSSGCYTLLKKTAGDWAVFGKATRGFVDLDDTGLSKGFNGMVSVYNFFSNDPGWWTAPLGFTSDTSQRAARIAVRIGAGAAIKTYRVPDSGTFSSTTWPWHPGLEQGTPIEDFAFSALPKEAAGPDGGFPVFTDSGGSFSTRQAHITYGTSQTGIMQISRSTSDESWEIVNNFGIDSTFNPGSSFEFLDGNGFLNPAGSGYLGITPFNTTMSFTKAIEGNIHPIVTSLYTGNSFASSDMYITTYESTMNLGDKRYFGRADSRFSDSFLTQDLDALRRAPQHSSSLNAAIPLNQTYPSQAGYPGKSFGTKSLFGVGANMELTHGNQNKVHILYRQTGDAAGETVISRVLFHVDAPEVFSGQTTVRFTPLIFPGSGIRNFAPATYRNAGGISGIVAWNGFKALRHPTLPGVGVNKQEFVATAGSGLFPRVSRLLVWDFNKSVEATQPLKVPTFSRELTKASGSRTPGFIIQEVFGPWTTNDVATLFDGDPDNGVSLPPNAGFVLKFSEPVVFSRVEAIRDGSFDISISVSGSLDNSIYNPVGFFDGDRLLKMTSEFDGFETNITHEAPDAIMDPFIAEYVRIIFGGFSPPPLSNGLSEIRLYGPHTTEGETVTGRTSFQSKILLKPTKVLTKTDFGSTKEGELPPGWRSSGDWDWAVQASGIYARPNGLSSSPLGNGKVRVGQFAGDPIGNQDGFSIRTQTGMPDNSSGILEIDIEVGVEEISENATSGRTVSFDIRYYLAGDEFLIDPEDDQIRFFVVPEFGNPLDGEVNLAQQGCFIQACDWLSIKTDVGPGNYTLKWMFQRKEEVISSPWNGEESVAWIDNVFGAQSSDGIPLVSINGVLFAQNEMTTSINAYTNGSFDTFINAYMSGLSPFEPINAYAFGMPDGFASVNGYLLGMRESRINALMVGGDGLGTIPTGVIYGHIATNSGIKAPAINGYLLGMKQGQINAYLPSKGEVSGVINSYLDSDYNFSSILARLGPSGETTNTQVLGYLPARAFESVNAYLINAGATTKILGFIPVEKSTSVNAYLFTPNDSGNAQVYGYLANSGSIAPSINAYMSGLSVFTPINGYLINDGKTSEVNGYLNVQDNSQINGYMQGRDLISTQVNAYMSGLGFIDTQVNSYVFGISGIIDESINGYMIGEGLDSQTINGYIIGHEDACSSHGTVPLVTVPTGFVIPSTCFNDGV